MPLGLVDEIMTGDEWLFRARESARLIEVTTEVRKTLIERLTGGFGAAARTAVDQLAARIAGGS